MTLEYDECSDVMSVSLSEPSSLCVYIESDTAGVLLRLEEATGLIRSFEVSSWSRRVATGPVLVPEVSDSDFRWRWTAQLQMHH